MAGVFLFLFGSFLQGGGTTEYLVQNETLQVEKGNYTYIDNNNLIEGSEYVYNSTDDLVSSDKYVLKYETGLFRFEESFPDTNGENGSIEYRYRDVGSSKSALIEVTGYIGVSLILVSFVGVLYAVGEVFKSS